MEKRSMLNEKIRSRFASGAKEEKKKKRRELRAIFSNGVLFKNPMLVGALGFIPCLPPAIPCGLPWSFPLFWRLCPYRGADSLLYRKSGSLMGAARFSCGSSGGAVYPCFRADGMAIPGGDSVFGHGGRHDVVNSMVLSRSAQYAPDHIPSAVLADTVGCSLGGTLVMCLAAFIREWLIYGDLKLGESLPLTAGRGLPIRFSVFLFLVFWPLLCSI